MQWLLGPSVKTVELGFPCAVQDLFATVSSFELLGLPWLRNRTCPRLEGILFLELRYPAGFFPDSKRGVCQCQH